MGISKAGKTAIIVGGGYIIVGVAWILIADALTSSFLPDVSAQPETFFIKRFIYVLLTAVLLSLLFHKLFTQFEDLQKRKLQLEQRLGEERKMETVALVTSQYAHDIRNQFMIIDNITQLYKGKLPELPDFPEAFKDLEDAVENINFLLKQMLHHGRRHAPTKIAIDLNKFIIHQAHTYIDLFGKNIPLKLELDPELGKIEASASEIEHILLNLILNACDAIAVKVKTHPPEDGYLPEITVRTSKSPQENDPEAFDLCVPKSFQPKHTPFVSLSVIDNGAGISEKDLANLFTPYFTTKGDQEGTGLGLYTIIKVVENYGGAVRVRSTAEGITEFQILWPKRPK